MRQFGGSGRRAPFVAIQIAAGAAAGAISAPGAGSLVAPGTRPRARSVRMGAAGAAPRRRALVAPRTGPLRTRRPPRAAPAAMILGVQCMAAGGLDAPLVIVARITCAPGVIVCAAAAACAPAILCSSATIITSRAVARRQSRRAQRARLQYGLPLPGAPLAAAELDGRVEGARAVVRGRVCHFPRFARWSPPESAPVCSPSSTAQKVQCSYVAPSGLAEAQMQLQARRLCMYLGRPRGDFNHHFAKNRSAPASDLGATPSPWQ